MAISEAAAPSFSATPKAAEEMESKATGGECAMVHYFFVHLVDNARAHSPAGAGPSPMGSGCYGSLRSRRAIFWRYAEGSKRDGEESRWGEERRHGSLFFRCCLVFGARRLVKRIYLSWYEKVCVGIGTF